MSGEEMAEVAAQVLAERVMLCVLRSQGIAPDDYHVVLNLLAGKLRAKADTLREGIEDNEGPSDDDLIDEPSDDDDEA